MYRERPSTVPGAVLWQATTTADTQVLPDGCMDLIWMAGDVRVAGPDTHVHHDQSEPGDTYVGLRFAPGALPELLGVPARELRDDRVSLSQLVPERVARPLVVRLERAASSSTPDISDAPGKVLEAFPATYVRWKHSREPVHGKPGQIEPLTAEIVRLLRSGTPVATVAREVNLSDRQLHRSSRERFGYGPKTLAAILRFQRALDLAAVDHSAASIALGAGYADQAHLIRETRRLAGTSFGALIRARGIRQPGSDANRSTATPSGSSTHA